MNNKLAFIFITILLAFTGCKHFEKPEPVMGKALTFDKLPGWELDQHSQALNALIKSCTRIAKKEKWAAICKQAKELALADNAIAKTFFEDNFTPHALYGEKAKKTGMITGYYEPLLHGSLTQDDRFKYPLYKSPEDMLIVELGELYPALKGKRVRGRLQGNKVVPYYARAEIDIEPSPLEGQELLWVDDLTQAFFLQIQGSGRVKLTSGKIIGASYANQNGHAYVSIGKRLIEMGELNREQISLFTIRSWLEQNPDRAVALLNDNPSYVFFTLRDEVELGPRGSLNVPLTPERSLAIDPKFVELGSPIWINTSYPDETNAKLQKLVMAQDTGGAIKGQLRADLFWGTGERAETMAGNMKQVGELYILQPNL